MNGVLRIHVATCTHSLARAHALSNYGDVLIASLFTETNSNRRNKRNEYAKRMDHVCKPWMYVREAMALEIWNIRRLISDSHKFPLSSRTSSFPIVSRSLLLVVTAARWQCWCRCHHGFGLPSIELFCVHLQLFSILSSFCICSQTKQITEGKKSNRIICCVIYCCCCILYEQHKHMSLRRELILSQIVK